jgi:Cof subfamily protein (haloacid dehalogenase superfamily)
MASDMPMIKLIATDLDGTLLRPDKVISTQTRQALERIQAAGAVVVLVTGRPVRTLRPAAQELGLTGLAVCSNGAIVYDLDQDAIVQHAPIAAEVASRLVVQLREAAPGVYFALELGLRYAREPAYTSLQTSSQQDALIGDALEFCVEPVTKLIVRHPELGVEALIEIVHELADGTALATHAGLPFVEISAAGVHKASALETLCARLGIRSEEVIAFGDMPNDLPMLAWAGHGVAVANAHPDVLQQAGEITLSNMEDGVAAVLERLIANNLLYSNAV